MTRAVPPVRWALALLVGAVLLSGCGGGGGSAHSDLSAAAATLLQKDTAALAVAARAGNGSAVQAALATLRRDVTAQRAQDGLSAARAAQVLAAAAQVAVDVPLPSPSASPRASVSTPVSTARPGRGKHHKEGDH